jgi:hypothetical protein
MAKNPGVDSQQPLTDAALRIAASRYTVEYHMYANPFNPFGVLITPEESEALWRELLALVRRRSTPGRGR